MVDVRDLGRWFCRCAIVGLNGQIGCLSERLLVWIYVSVGMVEVIDVFLIDGRVHALSRRLHVVIRGNETLKCFSAHLTVVFVR